MNSTLSKFGYPSSLLHEYASWAVLLRQSQPTIGSLVLACKEQATALGAVSSAAFAELSVATADIERVLRQAFDFQKINYLALMMVDPHVHFHVIPRYAGPRDFEGCRCVDPGWPRTPDLSSTVALTPAQMGVLHARLRSAWGG
jgi:diadenosine tetraphosphate (Ap4A) HIT family hydrolase